LERLFEQGDRRVDFRFRDVQGRRDREDVLVVAADIEAVSVPPKPMFMIASVSSRFGV
jgi:hypothetical protein